MSKPDVEVMRELLARVVAAKGPDRDLNVALAIEFTDWCRHEHTTRSGWQDDTGFTCDACGADSWGNKSASGQRLHDGCPAYTGSIDAAMTLMERVLPGATWAVAGPSDHSGRNRASVTAASPFRPMPVIAKGCATPGLNLVAALLTALIAAEDRHG